MKPKLDKSWINSHALDIVHRLQSKNFTTFLVGGCVRDLLLGIQPKDFDIVTLAKPKEVKRNISHCYIIGKRFRLVLAKREDLLLEIATFRSLQTDDDDNNETGMEEDLNITSSTYNPSADNFFGTPEEDAHRRDFTVNGLYYDPFAEKTIDYVNGLEDLESGTIRMIGEPSQRLTEDPIRILRGLRLAHKIRFRIEPKLRQAMSQVAHLLPMTPIARRREEILKFLRLHDPSLVFLESHDLGVLKEFAPTIDKQLSNQEKAHHFVQYLRTANEKSFSKEEPLFLFGFFIHAYIRCFIEPNPHAFISGQKLLKNLELDQIMKFELGMFNSEQELVIRAIKLQKTLTERHFYESKGEKSLTAIFKNEALPLALYLARKDFLLPPQDWLFWYNGYNRHHPQLLLNRPRT